MHFAQWIRSVTLLTLLAAFIGCASSQHSTGDTKMTRNAAGTVVEVKLDEYRIHMPTTIPAGHVVLEIANTGSHEHNIQIKGHGVDAKLPKNLRGGESATLELDLTPGEYKVSCPVGPHSALGMRLTLTVTS